MHHHEFFNQNFICKLSFLLDVCLTKCLFQNNPFAFSFFLKQAFKTVHGLALRTNCFSGKIMRLTIQTYYLIYLYLLIQFQLVSLSMAYHKIFKNHFHLITKRKIKYKPAHNKPVLYVILITIISIKISFVLNIFPDVCLIKLSA